MKIIFSFLPMLLAISCGDAQPLAHLAAELEYSPNKVDFPSTVLLQSRSADLTVANPGTATLEITQINLVDPNESFLVTFHSLTVPPNGKVVVQISFNPTSLGASVADLQLLHPEVKPGNTVIRLSGTGISPDPDQGEGEGEAGEGEGENSTGEGEGEPSEGEGEPPPTGEGEGENPPQSCDTQDDCGLNAQNSACAPDHFCHLLCRQDAECGAAQACRPLPGSVSIGFCSAAGTVAEGQSCASSSQCRVGMCSEGVCRRMCQRSSDCDGQDECGPAFYNNALGRRMTTACQPIAGRSELGESCLTAPDEIDTFQCASGACDFLPWGYLLSSEANCAPVCAGAGDCGPNQVCSLMESGLQEQPLIGGTGEGPGRYIDAYAGCYTPVDFFSGFYDVLPPGNQIMGASCSDDLQCRSYICAGFAPIVGRCSDFCSSDSDCSTPETPGWKCRVAEQNHTSMFMQGAQIADVSKFSLVGVCAP